MKTFKSCITILIILLYNTLSAQHISDFQSVNPNGRNGTLVLPETHTFQKLIQNGDPMTGGATFYAATDFTGYVPINGSSINGYLSINNESNTGGVAILDINFNQNTKLWNVSQSKYVDFSAFGRTSKNCSGTVTPWGTIITSEEVGSTNNDINNDGYFDYGWQVEIDPKTKQVIDKRWAMGRFSHENAAVHGNWRTVYQGEDAGEGYLYKFVADFPGDLSSGKLYVYKGSKTGGSGQWIQISNSSKFQRNNTHSLGDNVGATKFAGVEDVEVGPDGLVYFTVKSENKIYCFRDTDPINGTSVSFMNKFAGDRSYSISTANGRVNHHWGYGNDNLAFDNEGNLWVLQDGQNSHIWVVRKGHTESNPKVEIFATSPSGSEPTGITFSPDGRFIFLSIQHPNANTFQKDAAGTNMRFNNPATIVIARKEFLGASCDNNVCSTCNDGIRNFAETGIDCGGPCQACETCNDRIKNANETGIDCGPGCVACPSLSIAKTDITCNSNEKGTAVAQVTGGAGNITYLWSTGATTSKIDNLSAGNYSVKISDQNGNTATQSFSISQASSLNIGYTANQPSAQNASNGSINLSVSGGKSPYAYKWSNNKSSQDVSNLLPGNYKVTVTDNNGCVAFTEVPLAVLDCANFEVALSKTNITCRNARDASITALTAGGTAPFSYSWSNGSSNKMISNLNVGNYSVTVNDANGCSVANSISITQSNSFLSVNLNENGISSVDANDGSVSAAVSGGSSPYSYEWSTGSSASSLSNLSHGSYDVKVTDNLGCSVFKTAIIENYNCTGTVDVNLSAIDVKCYGSSNGVITSTVNGGTAPYSYNWSTGVTTSGLALLKPGNYYLTVTDAKGCVGFGNATINQPDPIEISHTYANESFELQIDTFTIDSLIYDNTGMVIETLAIDSLAIDTLVYAGSANVSAAGGSGSFSYNWSSGQTTSNVNNLQAGNYEIIVSDQNGCSVPKTITIQPYICHTFEASLNKNNAGCTANGNVSANLAGGTSPYNYLWSNGSNASSITTLSGGTYAVEIQDANGCIHNESIEIFESAHPLILKTQSTAISKTNVGDGKAMVSVEGGTPPYAYAWSNGATSASLSNLSSGSYTVTVTDALNCSVNETINVGNVDCSDMFITLNRAHGKCSGSVKGYIIADIQNAVEPISYNWNNNTNTSYLKDISSGNYNLSVADARGCSKNRSTSVNNGSSFSVAVNGNDFSAYNSNDGSANLTVSGGNSPFTYQWSNGATGTSINNLVAGVYEVLVSDKNGCIANDDTRIDNIDCANSNLRAQLIYEDVLCRSANNGSIEVVASGGNSPYSYDWLGSNASGKRRSNLGPGNYNVTLTDSKNCSISVTQNIGQPAAPLTLSFAKTNETYFRSNNGSATVTANGGTPPYQYIWSTGGGGKSLNSLAGGNYNVQVIDANGCSKTETFSISGVNCSNIALNVTANDVLCVDDANGNATANATGGTQPYSITWTNNDVGNAADNLSKGVYEAYVIDNVGCSTYKVVDIDEPANPLAASVSSTDITFVGQNDGSVSASASNGTPPYSYSWDIGVNNRNVNNLAPGSYEVTITDSNGCTETGIATINDIDCSNLRINALNVTNVSCFGENDGRVSAQISGGNTPYTFNWSNGGNGSTINGLSGGAYTLNAIGNKGCEISQSATVFEPTALRVNLTTTDETFGGANDGIARVNINGGSPPYAINWSNGANNLSANNLAPGNYTVLVKDANDCEFTESFTIVRGCQKVYDILANGVTNSTAVINWKGDENNGLYNLQYRNVTDNRPWQTTSTFQNSVILSNLKACKTYNFGVYSNCDPQNGVFVEFNTGGCTACDASSNLYTLNITEESAFLNWDIFPSASYTLYYRPGTFGNWNTYETDFSFAILFGLDDCQNYQWFIKTNCNGSLSPNSVSQQFTTGCNRDGNLSSDRATQLIHKVYPNPVTDKLFIEHAFNESVGTEFKIYDAAGTLHHQSIAKQQRVEFELTHLPKGLFTVYAKQGDTIETTKFVKE